VVENGEPHPARWLIGSLRKESELQAWVERGGNSIFSLTSDGSFNRMQPVLVRRTSESLILVPSFAR
jgi:hypothetical protein